MFLILFLFVLSYEPEYHHVVLCDRIKCCLFVGCMDDAYAFVLFVFLLFGGVCEIFGGQCCGCSGVMHHQEQRQRAAVEALKSKLGAIVKASDKQLKGKSHKTIIAIFQMLRTLCVALGGGLDAHIPSLIESTHRCLQDKNQVRDQTLNEANECEICGGEGGGGETTTRRKNNWKHHV